MTPEELEYKKLSDICDRAQGAYDEARDHLHASIDALATFNVRRIGKHRSGPAMTPWRVTPTTADEQSTITAGVPIYSVRQAIAETDLPPDMSSSDAVRALWERTARAESALCAHLGCTPEELAAGFELGDSPEEIAGYDLGGGHSARTEQLSGLAHFTVVGENNDKHQLFGWTEGDKQPSVHDELTFAPGKWEVGTTLVVYGPEDG